MQSTTVEISQAQQRTLVKIGQQKKLQYKMAIKEYISTKRTLSDKSLDTYCSLATSLYSSMFPDDTDGLTVEKIQAINNPALVEHTLENHETKYKKLTQKKVVLSTLAVIFELQIYRDMLLKLNREHKEVVDLQVQEEVCVDSSEIMELLTKLEKNATAIYKKKDLTPADLQEIQQYIILCLYCGKYIAPRRSQDYFNFKGKAIDKALDNYFDKDTDEFVFNSFKGRFINTKDKEGNPKVLEKATQRIPIPLELKKIITKWFKTTGHEYLLFDIQSKKINASQLNQRVNKMFGKTKGCGINQMRHADQAQVLADDQAHIDKQKKSRKPVTKKVVEIPQPESIEPSIVVSNEDKDEWEVCETCYKHIYNHNSTTKFQDRVYFCNQECLDIFQIKIMECESCGVKIREDKLTDDRCANCHNGYLNWMENYFMKLPGNVIIKSEIPERLEPSFVNDSKPQRHIYDIIIQSSISERLDASPCEVSKPQRHVYLA